MTYVSPEHSVGVASFAHFAGDSSRSMFVETSKFYSNSPTSAEYFLPFLIMNEDYSHKLYVLLCPINESRWDFNSGERAGH